MKKLAISILCLSFLSSTVSARIFTDISGKKFEANVVSISKDSVSLFSPGSTKIFTMPLAKLSAADRNYLAARSKGSPAPPRKEKQTPAKKVSNSSNTAKKTAAKSVTQVSSNSLKEKYRLADNYLTRLPDSVSISRNVTIRVVSEDKAKNRYVYHSPNYEFICDTKLSVTIVKQFSLLFEATREYCRKMPISSMRAHIPGRIKRNRILLFANQSNYFRSGGVPGSAGVYSPRTNTVMIPLSSLGVKKVSNGYNFDYTKSNNTITHELVHQLTDFEYYQAGARGWFSEGIAEYCAATPYQSGQFSLTYNKRNFKEYVTASGIDGKSGWRLGTTINSHDLKFFMLQPYGSFVSDGPRNYGLGLLITYYFMNMESDRKNITAFMKALKNGEKGEQALEKLLNGRSFDELEKDISNAWKTAGVTINFQ